MDTLLFFCIFLDHITFNFHRVSFVLCWTLTSLLWKEMTFTFWEQVIDFFDKFGIGSFGWFCNSAYDLTAIFPGQLLG